MSGHMFFADRYFGYDDALYAACRLIEIVARERQTAFGAARGIAEDWFRPPKSGSIAPMKPSSRWSSAWPNISAARTR